MASAAYVTSVSLFKIELVFERRLDSVDAAALAGTTTCTPNVDDSEDGDSSCSRRRTSRCSRAREPRASQRASRASRAASRRCGGELPQFMGEEASKYVTLPFVMTEVISVSMDEPLAAAASAAVNAVPKLHAAGLLSASAGALGDVKMSTAMI